jgi:hypothetical protein
MEATGDDHVRDADQGRIRNHLGRRRSPTNTPARSACGMLGPGTLHRVIAAAQKTILDSGMLAVGPSPKHGKSAGIAAQAGAR